jgi:hypothetical protein
MEVEGLQEERQNVLSPNTLEFHCGTIVVEVLFFKSLQLTVPTIFERKFPPKPLYSGKGLWPALVAVPADHVSGKEEAGRNEGRA